MNLLQSNMSISRISHRLQLYDALPYTLNFSHFMEESQGHNDIIIRYSFKSYNIAKPEVFYVLCSTNCTRHLYTLTVTERSHEAGMLVGRCDGVFHLIQKQNFTHSNFLHIKYLHMRCVFCSEAFGDET